MAKIVDNVVRIPCSMDNNFFKMWLLFLHPFHNLTDREMDLAACILKYRLQLSKTILDDDILNKVLFSDTIKQIQKECGINAQYYNVLRAGLRKAGFIKDNKINPRYIPNVTSTEGFKLMLFFDFRESTKVTKL